VGRAIGWYAMALIDCMDYFAKDHPDRKSIEVIFQKLCASILNFQDTKSGLWFQVINKGRCQTIGLKHLRRQCLCMLSQKVLGGIAGKAI